MPDHARRKPVPKKRQRDPSNDRITDSPTRLEVDEATDTTGEGRRSLKRASSVVLPAELAGISFLSLRQDEPQPKPDSDIKAQRANVVKLEQERDFRPPVPPKTSPVKTSPGTKTPPLRLQTTPDPSYKTMSPKDMAAKLGSSPPYESQSSGVESGHSREDSGDSIMDRGRPTKRNRSQTNITNPEGLSPDDLNGSTLPAGISAKTAREKLPWQEIRKLEHQANLQAERFELLPLKDVKALSQVSC